MKTANFLLEDSNGINDTGGNTDGFTNDELQVISPPSPASSQSKLRLAAGKFRDSKLFPVAVGAAVGAASIAAAPAVIGATLGVTAAGPVAGGLFAGMQGAALSAGSTLATLQSLVMTGASGGMIANGAALGGVAAGLLGKKKKGCEQEKEADSTNQVTDVETEEGKKKGVDCEEEAKL